ncbi:cyclin-domain-containing protein [Spinellus fusiger]|nr:cyclin-domain-containing protein [Spinellus fusiger]
MASFDISFTPTETVLHLLGSLLERMAAANDQLIPIRTSQRGPIPTNNSFRSCTIPSIPISSYLFRIFQYCPCTNECFLAILVYFDRMAKNSLGSNSLFFIDSYTIHRLVITGVMMATKFFADNYYTSSCYAKIGGIALLELNRLEIEFLSLNSYNLCISVEELQLYGNSLFNVGMEHERKMSLTMSLNPPPINHTGSSLLGCSMPGKPKPRFRPSIEILSQSIHRVSLEATQKHPLNADYASADTYDGYDNYDSYDGYDHYDYYAPCLSSHYGYRPFSDNTIGQPNHDPDHVSTRIHAWKDKPKQFHFASHYPLFVSSAKLSHQKSYRQLSLARTHAPPLIPTRPCLSTPYSLGCST